MGFESPILLLGLVGGLIPLIIHFMVRRQTQVVELDSFMFLVLGGGHNVGRLRFVHAVILAIRVLAILVIVLMFARPYIFVSASVAATEQPVAMALVLDDSMSMRLSDGKGTAWDRALAHARRILSEQPSDAEIHVILAGKPVIVLPSSKESWSPSEALSAIGDLQARRVGTDLVLSLNKALELVRSSPHGFRRIAMISDFRSTDQAPFPGPLELTGVDFLPFDVAGASSANVGIVSARAFYSTERSLGHARVRVEILNSAKKDFDGVVTVRIGSDAVARKVPCVVGDLCVADFLLKVDESARHGEVRIPADALPDDDVRWFPLLPRNRFAVLVVNGSPSQRAENDEAYFLTRALGLRLGGQTGFSITEVRPEELSPLHMAAVGVVALLNVDHLAPDQVAALNEFAASGGGIFLSMGDRANIDQLSESFADLLPACPRDLLSAPDPARSIHIGSGSAESPITSGLLTEKGSLTSVVVRKWILLDDGWASGSTILASLENGLPILVQRNVGSGVVVAWLSTVDRDWTDLPLRPVFAPFMRNMFNVLGTYRSVVASPEVVVGEPRHVIMREGETLVRVHPPSGKAVDIDSSGDHASTSQPGVYRLSYFGAASTKPLREEIFVVNTDPVESRVTLDGPLPPAVAANMGTPTTLDLPPVRKVAIWQYLALLVLLLFAAEGFLKGRG